MILAEAAAAGWAAEGTDIDVAAVDAAARAAPGASVQLGDARELLLPDDYARRLRDVPAGSGPSSGRARRRLGWRRRSRR